MFQEMYSFGRPTGSPLQAIILQSVVRFEQVVITGLARRLQI